MEKFTFENLCLEIISEDISLKWMITLSLLCPNLTLVFISLLKLPDCPSNLQSLPIFDPFSWIAIIIQSEILTQLFNSQYFKVTFHVVKHYDIISRFKKSKKQYNFNRSESIFMDELKVSHITEYPSKIHLLCILKYHN